MNTNCFCGEPGRVLRNGKYHCYAHDELNTKLSSLVTAAQIMSTDFPRAKLNNWLEDNKNKKGKQMNETIVETIEPAIQPIIEETPAEGTEVTTVQTDLEVGSEPA